MGVCEKIVSAFNNDTGSAGKKMINGPVQHFRALDLRFKEGHDGPDPIPEDIPNLTHMLVLHLNPVEHKLHRILPHLLLLNHPVHNDPAYGNPELVEPVDESGDHSDRKAFGQGNEKEGG